MVDVARLAIEVDSSQAVAAKKNLDSLSVSAAKTTGATGKMDEANKKTSHSARMMAMQLSQVASQGSVTGNYLQALAIQLPDLVLGFGTIAIVAGAVAGALAGPLISSLQGSQKSIGELSDEVDALSGSFEVAKDGSFELAEELVRLAKISEQTAKLKVAVETESARKNILNLGLAMIEAFSDIGGDTGLSALDKLEGITSSDKLAKNLNITAEEALRLQKSLSMAAQSTDPEMYGEFASVLQDLSGKYGRNNRQLLSLTSSMSEFIVTGANSAENLRRLTEAGTDWDALLDRSTENLGQYITKFQKFEEILTDSGAFKMTLVGLDQTEIDRSAFSYADYVKEQQELDAMRLQSRADTLKQVESLEMSQMSANERLLDSYLEQQFVISDALAQGVISTEEANALKYQSDLEYAEKKQQLDAQAVQAQMAANDAFLSAAQNLNNNLLAALEAYEKENTQVGKAAIAAQKGMMIVQAIMSAELAAIQTQAAYAALAAATSNPALVGVGATHAGVVRGMGYASATLIAATEFQPSFLGGGYTGSGSRTGGIDGMGGFPAILHPNEAVFDMTRGTGMAVNPDSAGGNQTVVFQISTGVSQTVRAEMAAMLPGIVKMVGQAASGRRS